MIRIENLSVIIEKSPFFKNMEKQDLEQMLSCLKAYSKKYEKEEFIYHRGDRVRDMGIVVTGSVHIVKEDFWGNRNIIAHINPGQSFAETYACLGIEELKVDVIASEKAEILFLNIQNLWQTCSNVCDCHGILIRNFIRVLAGKNLVLTGKIEHIMQRSTREKLLSYLSEQSEIYHSAGFTIPFDRQQLADYLSVDRSAMSNELSKLRKEGMIDFRKNEFRLISPRNEVK